MTREQFERVLAQENARELKSSLDALNDRELEFFSALSQGYTRGQMQCDLGMEDQEQAALKKSIQQKLKLKSDVALIQLAARQTREG